jgi:hypothetical protein
VTSGKSHKATIVSDYYSNCIGKQLGHADMNLVGKAERNTTLRIFELDRRIILKRVLEKCMTVLIIGV